MPWSREARIIGFGCGLYLVVNLVLLAYVLYDVAY
jgi:hypothetical protein